MNCWQKPAVVRHWAAWARQRRGSASR